MNTTPLQKMPKHNIVRRSLSCVYRKFQSIGVYNAKEAIESATEINMYRTRKLAMYGDPYRKTYEFARLQLGEKVALFKYELYKSLFRL